MIIRASMNQALPLLLVSLWWNTSIPVHAAEIAQDAGIEFTLAEALAFAEAHQPALIAARLEVQAAESRVAQAAVRSNPGLTLEAENFGGKEEYSGFDAAEYTATVEQTMEFGGKRGKRIHAAALERRLSDFDLETKRLDIQAETTRRFITLQGARERLALSEESVALAEEFVRQVAARVRGGKVAPMDEDKAQILLSQQKLALDGSQQEYQAARLQLSAMWGSVTSGFNRVQGLPPTLPDVPAVAALIPGMASNPDLARWTTEGDHRKGVLSLEKAARFPDVTIAGSIRRYAASDSPAFVAGLTLPLPVFDRNQGKVREASLLLDMAGQQRRAAEIKTFLELTEAHQAVSAARHRISLLDDDIIPRAKSVFDAMQAGYVQGKFSCLDVLDARRTFLEARIQRLETLVSGHRALAGIQRAIGRRVSTVTN
jgi:cobalt-zinc-cadmium efflux system outer membrane protein